MKIRKSNKLSDICDVNLRSANAKSGICIFELGSLDQIIGMKKAEIIREKLLKNNVKTKQLTNHKTLKEWTNMDNFVGKTMDIRYISPQFFTILHEILIFDDTVALYRGSGEIFYLEINDTTYTKAMRQLFKSVWLQAQPMKLKNKGAAIINNERIIDGKNTRKT